MSDSLDHVFKILMIGDAGVGKSSILQQFTDGYFSENLQSTIGVDFKVKVMTVLGPDERPKRVKVTIWDTAGQERFRTLTSSYYRGAQGIIMVYDVARKDTFESLNMWLQEVEQFSMNGGKDVVKLLVGNKIDQHRLVERGLANSWAKEKGMLFMEASAKTKEGITQVFTEVVSKILENPNLLANTRPSKPRGTNLNAPTNQKSSGGCC
jgi:Ras-related protein Rab-18